LADFVETRTQTLVASLVRRAGKDLGQEDLQRLARIYETILASTDDFVYIFDPQGHFLYANPSLLKLLARTLDQVIGKTCYELGYPTWHADMHTREIEQIVRDKVQIRGEVFFTGASGTSGYYDYIFKPVFDARGEVDIIVGTTRDVTDRKRDEEKLKAVETELRQQTLELEETAGKFRALFDQAAVFAGILTTDGVLIESNDISLIQCGYLPADVFGRPFWECGWWTRAPEAAAKIRRAIAAAAAGTPYRETLPYHYANGTERVVDFSITPIRNQDGKVIYLNPAGVDVTDAYRAHAQAHFFAQLTQKLSTVSEEAEINRIATAELGRFLRAQRAFCFQILPGGEQVRVLPDWHAPELSSVAGDFTLASLGTPELLRALAQGTVAIDDVRSHPWTQSAAESYLSHHIAAFAFAPFSRDGQWIASIGVVSGQPRPWTGDEKALLENVTARIWPRIERARSETALRATIAELRDAQEALRQANVQLGDRATHLEAIVQQRTHKLSETIGDLEAFSYSISHDMRAPLRSLIGFSDILLEDYAAKLDAEGAGYLKRIGAAARRMDLLIQDVLSFSRISGADITLQPVCPRQLLREVIASYPNLQSDHVVISIAEDLPRVLAHETLLTQCFSNLLENAARFAVPGQKALVHISAISADGRTRLIFKDNGIGIPAHSLQRIFEIFQRVGRDGTGTGIGLAIVRKAVEKMGGSVGVESEPGRGSVFWLDLPSVPATD